MALIDIAPSERVFLTGRTGCGKTTMAKRFLAKTSRWVVTDPKGTFRMEGIPILDAFDKSKKRQIIRMPYDVDDDVAYWGEVIKAAYDDGNRVIYNDEVVALIRGPQNLPRDLRWAITTGRERNVAVWNSTQRPKAIPSQIFTETEHFFTFALAFKADREKVLEYTDEGLEEQINALARADTNAGGHDCVYWKVGTRADQSLLIH
jgi:energy-coupling factor transporter ATP-binding protein EcfA2